MEKYPFNKERAMKGDPVVTRDGRNAKFIEEDKITGSLSFDISDVYFSRWFCPNGKYCGPDTDRDLFMLTPDPAPSAPIPFDWDKYNSGEWDAVTRKGSKATQLHLFDVTNCTHPICGVVDDKVVMWRRDGLLLGVYSEHNLDLLLTPKQVTRWFNAYKDKYNNVGAGCTHDSEQDALANIDSERVHIGTYSFTTNVKS